jgi:Fic family protein
MQRGYLYVPYASLESVIEENKDLYYAALRRTQGTLKQARPDWEPWVLFFLRSLKKQKEKLAVKLERERVLARSLLPLSLEILSLLGEHERLRISQLESLTRANKNTLKVRLRELAEGQLIARYGKGKATYYMLGTVPD